MIVSGDRHHLTIETPAKVNLYLEVLGKRPDGYHELDTIMLAVSLTDRLVISPRDDDQIRLQVHLGRGNGHEVLTNGPENLVCRAIEAARQSFGSRQGLNLQLWKNIPMEAGLGGGSSNAAAALVAANAFFATQWDPKRLSHLASQLGSDINFFLDGHANGAWLARCQGRGEMVSPLSNQLDAWFVIAKPPVGCSTRSIFSRLTMPTELVTIRPSLVAIERNDLSQLGASLTNRLRGAAFEDAPDMEKLFTHFAAENVLGYEMSGSGSAQFAICRSSVQAKAVAKRVEAKHLSRVYVVRSWRSPPLVDQLRAVGFAM